MNKNDTYLVEQAKQDPQSFEELYRKYADKVFNYFWYRTGHDKMLSEDLMQDTFVRAFKHLKQFKVRGYSYLTYLLTIARHILIDHYRKPTSVPIEDAEDVPFEITQDIDKKSDGEALWHAIQTLPSSNRDVLLMHYQQDMPVKSIAQVTGASENAVKLNLSRTRKKLAAHPYLQDIRDFADKKRKYTNPRFMKKKA
ncbi:MAG: sigma-70 family RNA polymerase sigma factor [Patescibacteria group bacterium]|nr:sigma-70 family RNA polymerase sigma factor [Patescibacteria group bacterium]